MHCEGHAGVLRGLSFFLQLSCGGCSSRPLCPLPAFFAEAPSEGVAEGVFI
jgi:hypothetical protein